MGIPKPRTGGIEMKAFMIATAVTAFCFGIIAGTLVNAQTQTGIATVMPSSLDAPFTSRA
jgi:hypothetical protein